MGEWNLGKRLRRFRTRKGYSIYDVQRQTNYHYTTISKYERNQRQPSLEALRELAACYEVTIADLLADEDELVHDLPTHLQEQASLLVERRELAEMLDLIKELPPAQIGRLIDFLKPFIERAKDAGEDSDPENDAEQAAPKPGLDDAYPLL